MIEYLRIEHHETAHCVSCLVDLTWHRFYDTIPIEWGLASSVKTLDAQNLKSQQGGLSSFHRITIAELFKNNEALLRLGRSQSISHATATRIIRAWTAQGAI